MQDSNANQATSPSPITHHPAPTARRSGGPRTAAGKRRSCQNARQHGLYTDERFLEGAALELGEDPRQFQRLLRGLVEARQPVGALEMALLEDIALLLSKKARLDRAELAVQVCNLHQHDLERRKLSIQVGSSSSDAVEFDVREKGLRRFLDSPGKFEQVLGLLSSLIALIDKNEFGYEMREALIGLYGGDFTLRGVKLDEFRYALAKMPEGEAFEKAKRDMTGWVAEEMADVGREYDLFLHEHVENTRAARMAATAPSHAQWAAIIRQQNSLARQLEHKIRLLMELQRERKSEAQLLESLEAPSPRDPSGPREGGPGLREPAECPAGASPGAHPSACESRGGADVPSFGMSAPVRSGAPTSRGMAQTSSCEVCDVPKGQAGTDLSPRRVAQTCRPVACLRSLVSERLHPDRMRRDVGATRDLRALLTLIGALFAAAFKKFKNRGNELKDLLPRQGITEIVISKRTHIRAEKDAIGAERSGISRIVGGRLAVPWFVSGRTPSDKMRRDLCATLDPG